MHRSGIVNDSSSAHGAELRVRLDDDKCNYLRSPKNRFGLHCHPSCLTVETRPILLEDHL